MQVVILCGGLGTRLREETEFRPKPMVEIGGKPILWHIMKMYSCYGFNDFILCLGYKGEMIKEYFINYEIHNSDFTVELGNRKDMTIHKNHSELDWRVTLADTGDKSLKGARLKRIEKYIHNDVFMMTYGDGVADIRIDALLAFHESHGKLGTLTGVSLASRFGELNVQGEQVKSFVEKPKTIPGFINGGFFVFRKEIFDYLADDENCDLESGVLEKIAEEGQLMVFKHQDFWACMDNLRDVDYLNGLWAKGQADWKVW